MSHDPAEPSRQTPQDRKRPIPTRVISLRAEQDAAPDYIAPLAALAIIVSLLGTTCVPLWTVMSLLAHGQAARVDVAVAASSTTAPATQPAPPQIPVVTLAGVLIFFLIAMLGIVGGFGSILRRAWGRKVLLAYAALVLLYLITATYFRMRFGIESLVETAPTQSALSLNFTCVFGVFVLVAVLMIVILRYFTLPHIARRFR